MMGSLIILTKSQADSVRGNHGGYSAIDPVPLPDGTYVIPEECLSDPDLLSIQEDLNVFSGNTQNVDELPDVGVEVYAGQTYTYSDGVLSGYSEFVICIQSHTRMDFPPSETPALFTFTRAETDDLEWISNEQVYVGWKRIYNDIKYVVIQSHMTQNGWEPPNVPALWSVNPTGTWAVGVYYNVNDEVSYDGSDYKCLQGHTSQGDWAPPNVPALWELI